MEEFKVQFVSGPGVDDSYSKAVLGGDAPDNDPAQGVDKAAVLEYLRQRHAEEGWADELEYPLYRQQHEWGLAQLTLFEQHAMPVAMPVRHGAYVVVCNVS